jgi:hypothetical protein
MLLKRLTFIRDTGLTSEEDYEDYLMGARVPSATEREEMDELGISSVYTYRKHMKAKERET